MLHVMHLSVPFLKRLNDDHQFSTWFLRYFFEEYMYMSLVYVYGIKLPFAFPVIKHLSASSWKTPLDEFFSSDYVMWKSSGEAGQQRLRLKTECITASSQDCPILKSLSNVPEKYGLLSLGSKNFNTWPNLFQVSLCTSDEKSTVTQMLKNKDP